MFRWCSYCYVFQGEREPFDDFSATHGICPSCDAARKFESMDAVERIRPVAELHRELANVAVRAVDAPLGRTEASGLVERGRAAGIQPVDLLVGILQPVLYEVGRRWSDDGLEPDVEARFTAFSQLVLEVLEEEQRQRIPKPTRGPVFLTTVPLNRHWLGASMLAFILREADVDVSVMLDVRSVEQVIAEVERVRPETVGISAALEEHQAFAQAMKRRLEAETGVRVVLGGLPTKERSRAWTAEQALDMLLPRRRRARA